MRGRLLANLLLLAVVAVLLALAWFEPGRESPPAIPLSRIEPGTIGRIQVQWPRGRGMDVRQAGDGWRMAMPYAFPADDLRVRGVLALARAESLARFSAPDSELRQFGLDPPRARVVLDEAVFEFGDTEPLDGRRYVLHAGEVHLIADSFFQHLNAEAAAYLHPGPMGPDAEPVELSIAGTRLRLEDGRWQREPPSIALSADRLNALADDWATVRAMSVSRFDSSLDWTQTVDVRRSDETEPRSFRVAWTDYELVLGRPDVGIQYHVMRKAGERLLW